MMKKLIYGILCLSFILTACSPSAEQPSAAPPAPTPPSKVSPEQPEHPPKDPNAIHFFDCGILDLSNSDSIEGRENFEEFLNVTGSGTAASIQITHESEDSTATLTFADGVYTFQASGKESTWKQLQITESVTSGQIRQTFRLTNTQDLPADTPDGTKAITLFQETIES